MEAVSTLELVLIAITSLLVVKVFLDAFWPSDKGSVLGSQELRRRLKEIFGHNDQELVNPASVDIRIGSTILVERKQVKEWLKNRFTDDMVQCDMRRYTEVNPYVLGPGEFVLISTYEDITVPNGLVMDLKLKSTCARQGFNHSLAFWVDPGWSGVLTMEIQNVRKDAKLPLWYGMRFAQAILYTVKGKHDNYKGRYQYAKVAEGAKS